MVPQLAAREVEHVERHRQFAARPVVGQHEGGGFRRGILRAGHAEAARLQALHHLEHQLRGRGIVQHVPGPEAQGVAALAELRDGEAHRAAAIVAEVIGEIVVQVVGAGRRSVDDQLQVVADAAARGVDAAVVVELCHEVGRLVHLVAVGKRAAVQVAVDAGADGVGLRPAAGGQREAALLAVGGRRAVAAQGVERHQAAALGVADVLGHGEGQPEAPCADAVGAAVEHLRAVTVDERLVGPVGTGVVQLAGDGLLGIPDGGGHHAAEP